MKEMATPDGDMMGVMSSYERKSGIRWNRVVPGFSLLRNAGYEAQQQLDSDAPLVRSLFITGLLYILEALPTDLTPLEISQISAKLPEQFKQPDSGNPSRELDFPNAQNTRQQVRYISANNGTATPLLHRVTATTIINLCLLIQFLLPHIRVIIQRISESEWVQRAAEQVMTASSAGVSRLCKGGADLGSTALKASEGRAGQAMLEMALGAVAAISGGIGEGVSKGVVILGQDKRGDTIS